MNASTPADVRFSFTGLTTRADEHRDGFGIAFFEDQGMRVFVAPDGARAFCWPMRELAKAHADMSTVAEPSATLRELLPVLHAHGSFNLLLSNGQALWAHASTRLH